MIKILKTICIVLLIASAFVLGYVVKQNYLGAYSGKTAYAYASFYGDQTMVIDKQNSWHAIIGLSEGITQNMRYQQGVSSTITGYWDAGGGYVGVSSTIGSMGITDGDYVTITGSTNYDAIEQISSVTASSFLIQATWVANDGTGKARHGTEAEVNVGAGGTYNVQCDFSAASATANQTFEFTLIDDGTTNGIIQRKFGTAGDVGASTISAVFEANAGDEFYVAARNITGANNIVFKSINCHSFKIK